MGRQVNVTIMSAGKHHLMGDVLNSSIVQIKESPNKERAGVNECSETKEKSPRLLYSDVFLIILFCSLVSICLYKLDQWNIIRTLLFS